MKLAQVFMHLAPTIMQVVPSLILWTATTWTGLTGILCLLLALALTIISGWTTRDRNNEELEVNDDSDDEDDDDSYDGDDEDSSEDEADMNLDTDDTWDEEHGDPDEYRM
jgi:hypothetical protein